MLDCFSKVVTVILIPFLRCIVIYWESALQQINTGLHYSKIIVRFSFFDKPLFFKTNHCKNL